MLLMILYFANIRNSKFTKSRPLSILIFRVHQRLSPSCILGTSLFFEKFWKKVLRQIEEIPYNASFRNRGARNMVRISKQSERRNRSPRRTRSPSEKTGPRPANLPLGFKEHPNAIEGEMAKMAFIPKIR